MNLTPTELERLTIYTAAGLARKHRAKELLPTRGTRKLNKQHMMHNSACPKITVDSQTFDIFVDGELATCEPAETLPLTQRYMLR